jgi:hypothetical protein
MKPPSQPQALLLQLLEKVVHGAGEACGCEERELDGDPSTPSPSWAVEWLNN